MSLVGALRGRSVGNCLQYAFVSQLVLIFLGDQGSDEFSLVLENWKRLSTVWKDVSASGTETDEGGSLSQLLSKAEHAQDH